MTSQDVRVCAICRAILEDHEEKTHLPCGHSFHKDCIDSYAAAKSTSYERLPCAQCKVVPMNAENLLLAQGVIDENTFRDSAPRGDGGSMMLSDAESAHDSIDIPPGPVSYTHLTLPTILLV